MMLRVFFFCVITALAFNGLAATAQKPTPKEPAHLIFLLEECNKPVYVIDVFGSKWRAAPIAVISKSKSMYEEMVRVFSLPSTVAVEVDTDKARGLVCT